MIRQVLEAWLRDCRSRDLSPHTIEYYTRQILFFEGFCHSQGVYEMEQVSADLLRLYLISLESEHNAGGKHARYRAVKVFLLWYEREEEPQEWSNPIYKVKPPKVPEELIEGISIEDVKKLIATCDDSFTGLRDKAAMMFLLDTGIRVAEFCALDRVDISDDGGVFIRHGKGNKPRLTYMGSKTTRIMRKYSRRRDDNHPALWIARTGERWAISTVQGMLRNRAEYAQIPIPSPHDFRRAFVLNMLRSGKVDVFTLKLMTGHTTLEMLGRYAAKVRDDAKLAHEQGSPVDRLLV